MYDKDDALYIADILNISFDKFTVDDFITGLNIETEHGSKFQKTNITNDNIIKTAKIALAHLNEYPNYYNKEYGLPKFEDFLKEKMNEK